MPADPTYRRSMSVRQLSLIVLCVLAPCSISHASKLRDTPIVRAVKAASPAVVNIHGHKTVDGPNEDGRYEGPRRVNGMGTGVVIDQRGYIITNHHVIDGVKRIQVTLADGRTYTARLVAHDPKTDLAVIRINPTSKLPLIKIGTSKDLMTGEPVIAVGNAYGYHHTVTRGIVSALQRTVEVTDSQKYYHLIQTDASINPGNSGGPLLNIDGDMIGINVAVRVGAQGIGFAIPVDQAMQVAAQLMQIERTMGTWHGVTGNTIVRSGKRAFLVSSVQDNSPAKAAGIQSGDVIERIGSFRIQRALDLERALLGYEAGSEVKLVLFRNQSHADCQLKLANASRTHTAQRQSPNVAAQIWDVLGVRLTPMSSQAVRRRVNVQYNGGLQVTSVRRGGPAERNGIIAGDILVGIHNWETISLDNVDYILNQAELDDPSSVRFTCVRGSEVRIGEIPVIRR